MAHHASTGTIKSFIFTILKPIKFWLIAAILVQLTWAIDLSLRPYIIKVIIDKLQHIDSSSVILELRAPVTMYVSLSLFVIFMFRFYDYIYLNISPILKRSIGDLLMQRMMQHSLTIFQNNFAGNLATKIKDVMSGIPDLIRAIDEQMSLLIGMLIAAFTMWTINYQFALLFIVWLTIFVGISLFSIKRAKELCVAQADIRSLTVGQMVDMLGNIVSIKLFASREAESKQLMGYLNKYVAAEQKRDWYFLWLFACQGLSFVIYQSLVFLLLIYGFKAGLVTAGDFALLTMLNISIINQLWSLSKLMLGITEIYGNVTQGLKIVMRPIEIIDKIGATQLQIKRGKIEFDNIVFNYHGVAPIFSNKSITIHPGQKVGLVGYSGGGKSTFVNLILRLYDIKAGQLLIDGQNVQDVTQDSLHKNIAMIPQDPSLFHRTLMENIRYGRFDATDAEVIDAAKKANAHEFIQQLPEQYNSLVGERGVKLSGGQRQRIAIARAILKNAPILILDEATSQLDSVTEKQIQESLWQAMENKTTLVIAHRLSTLLHMDRILVFHHGKIIQDGTHQELIAQNSLYKTLWDTQVGGFIAV